MDGNHRLKPGNTSKMPRVITSTTTSGHTPRKMVPKPTLGSRVLITNRFMPTGGEIRPIWITITISTPNHTGSKPSWVTIGKNSGMVSSTMVSSSITVPRIT